MTNWDALANEWKAIVRTHRDDEDRLQSQLDRLVERWDGEIEDTGGGFTVGIVRLGDESFAQVSVDAIARFDGLDDALFDPPVEELHFSDVIA